MARNILAEARWRVSPPAMWNLMAEEFAQWLLRRGRAAQTVNFALSRQALGEQLLDEYFKSHKASGADGGRRRPTAGDYVCSNSNLERIFLILMLQSLKEPAIQSLWLFVVFFGFKVCRARSRL